jgi:hypothetical protein
MVGRVYHGKGTLRSKEGDLFEGEFERGTMRRGSGKIALDEGFVYEGEIYDGEPSGYGKQYHPSTLTSPLQSIPAPATYRWPSSAKKEGYEGYWQDGTYGGKGKLFTPDGATVEGTFEKGVVRSSPSLAALVFVIVATLTPTLKPMDSLRGPPCTRTPRATHGRWSAARESRSRSEAEKWPEDRRSGRPLCVDK